MVVWPTLTFPFLKVNVDDSWPSSTRNSFVSVMICESRSLLVVVARYEVKAHNATTAKALAMLRDCELANALGHRQVIFLIQLKGHKYIFIKFVGCWQMEVFSHLNSS